MGRFEGGCRFESARSNPRRFPHITTQPSSPPQSRVPVQGGTQGRTGREFPGHLSVPYPAPLSHARSRWTLVDRTGGRRRGHPGRGVTTGVYHTPTVTATTRGSVRLEVGLSVPTSTAGEETPYVSKSTTSDTVSRDGQRRKTHGFINHTLPHPPFVSREGRVWVSLSFGPLSPRTGGDRSHWCPPHWKVGR